MVNIKGNRIAPFRKITVGHTGKKIPERDFTFASTADKQYMQKV